MIKLVVIAVAISTVSAGVPLEYPHPHEYDFHAYEAPAPVPLPVVKTVIAEPSAPAHYDYGYAVNDPLTGDSKSQHESRRGDIVQGSYSVVDPDGTKRTVNYVADPHNGFNAIVNREPLTVAVKTVAPVAPLAHAPPLRYAHEPHYFH